MFHVKQFFERDDIMIYGVFGLPRSLGKTYILCKIAKKKAMKKVKRSLQIFPCKGVLISLISPRWESMKYSDLSFC